MALLASDIISRVSESLNDVGLVRWSEAEMLRAINDAEKAVLKARPDLYETTRAVALVAGPQQDVPSDCYLLLDVLYNVDGSDTPTAGITRVRRTDLDKCKSDWMLDDPETEVQHWMQANRERGKYYVYPRQPTVAQQLGRVMLRFAKYPTKPSQTTSTLDSPDEMINPLYYFTTMRMLEKDEKFAGSKQAQDFRDMFAASMGVRTEGEDQADADREERE